MQQARYTIMKDEDVIKDDLTIQELAEFFGDRLTTFRLHGKAGFDEKFQTETEYKGYKLIKISNAHRPEDKGADNFPLSLLNEWDLYTSKFRKATGC